LTKKQKIFQKNLKPLKINENHRCWIEKPWKSNKNSKTLKKAQKPLKITKKA